MSQRVPASVDRAAKELRGLAALIRCGMLGAESPSKLLSIGKALHAYGAFGSATRIAALRHGDATAIVDARGSLSFQELDDQVNSLAESLRKSGVGQRSKIGILCRNHRAPLIVAFACARLGADAIYLNTGFSPRQAEEVAVREGLESLFFDIEFAAIADSLPLNGDAFSCEPEHGKTGGIDELIARSEAVLPEPPKTMGRIVLLTSGTTGTPKGAARPDPRGFIGPGAILERLPMKAGGATVIVPPLFHGTGLLIALLSLALGSKLVLRPRYDAAEVLEDVQKHQATTVCLVPIMLQRILALGPEKIDSYDLSSLEVLFSAGSQLPAHVAQSATEQLGEVVYNLYGSTEVSIATLATPSDVREAPTSVGKPVFSARVRILDDQGTSVAQGEIGRIFVGTNTPFEGYTGGGAKEIVDGLLATGDLGHLDAEGRLYVDGRDDEMIISGGENVFPREIEELLIEHPSVHDAAAIGVPDEEFGQRLCAFIVLLDGEELSVDGVKEFVKSNLARYKVPRDVVFLPSLPRNPTGKVLKRELAQSVSVDRP
ncbi:MAG: AMP-binding protein [Solirubrobacterales bacterium]